MKRKLLFVGLIPILLFFTSVLFSTNSYGQIPLLGWDCNPIVNGANLFGPSPFNPTTVTANVTGSGIIRGAGVSTTGTGANRAFGGVGFNVVDATAAIAANKFFAFTIAANSGYNISLSSINPFDYRRSATGPPSALIQYSINGGTYIDITTISFPTTASSGASAGPVDLSIIPALQNLPSTSTVSFRIVPYGATGATGTWYIFDVLNSTVNDFVVNGTVTSAAVPTLTSTALTFPTTCLGSNNILPTTITGSNLTGSSVLVGPFSSYGFSTNPAGPFDPSVTLSYVGSSLSSTVYVQYLPLAAGANNGNIALSGGGATGTIATTAQAFSVPTVTATSLPSPATVCAGTSVTLTGSGATTYTWSDGVNTQTDGVSFTPAASSTYTVTGTTSGCSSTNTVVVTVNPAPTTPVITATPTAICIGGNSDLNAVSTGNSIRWYDALTSGTLLTTVASATNYNVTPGITTTYYAEAVAPAGGTQTFNYTGSTQTFTVPAGVTSIQIESWGAQGNSNAQGVVGGLGGYATGTLAVTPGDILYLEVGGGGTISTTGGYNGGGSAGAVGAPGAFGGGGGGCSDVRLNVNSLATRVIVAAGGGGAGGNRVAGLGRGTGGGGGGGYYGGGGGAAWPNLSIVVPTGGNQFSGGIGGTSTYATAAPNNNGLPGVLGIGGKGGDELTSNQADNQVATSGGAGGGLSGADGTYAGNFAGQSGAGGSSYTTGLSTASTTSGIRSGNGQIILTWTGFGCASNPRTPVTVTVNPIPTVTASSTPSPAIVCAGNSVTLTGGGATTYTWTDGVNTPTDGVSFVPASSSTYTVTGTTAGCSSTATLAVTVNPTPTVTASSTPSPATVCAGSSVTLTGGGATTYSWTDGVNTPTDGVSFVPASSSTYTVTGTTAGCSSTATLAVTVNPIPTITASSTPSPATVCAGSSVTLTGAGATTYTWSDGVNTQTDGISFIPAASSTYTVTGTSSGCTSTATLAVTVNPIPTVTASSTPSPATICFGSSVTLTGGGASTYTWSDGVNTPTDGISFIPATSSTYTVTGTTSGCSSTATLSVTVNPAPISPTVSATPTAICAGGNSNLNAVSTGNTINWYDALTAGTLLTTVPSSTNYNVTPGSTTTYFAEAVSPAGGTQTFNYTGSAQTFIVPAGVTSIDMECWGAQGGANWINNTNFGGYSKGTIAVTPGETLTIYVGNQPTTIAGGFNGGGAGDGAGRAGGGASDVRQGGTGLNNRIIVAAGGGGAGYWSSLHVVGGVGGGANLSGGDGYRNTISDPGGCSQQLGKKGSLRC